MKKGIKSVLAMLIGGLVGIGITEKRNRKKIDVAWKMSEKHFNLFIMMSEWVRIKQEGKSIADYLKQNEYKTIAIYGMSYAGERLLEELQNSGVLVKYAIDKKADEKYSEVDICLPEEKLEAVDAIIVTAITFVDEIEKMLSKKVSCPIISLEDILYEL